MQKIKILITSLDTAGILYWRSQTVAVSINKNHSDEFDVEINQNVDWSDENYLKQFNIIHTHRQFGRHEHNDSFFAFCKKNDIVTIMDLDDYYELPPTHSLYSVSKMENFKGKTIDLLKRVDGCTTTTEYYRDILLQHNNNVIDLENGVDSDIMPSFKFKRQESKRLRISSILGSSHESDIQQLKDCFQVLASSPELHSKLTIGLHGYDLRGSVNNISLNEDLVKECVNLKISLPNLFQEFNKCDGNIDKLTIPQNLKDKYRFDFVKNDSRAINKTETVWYRYEQIFTDNYKLIRDPEYLQFLQQYIDEPYPDEENQVYRRFFTLPVNTYARHYNDCDVSLVALNNDSEFNRCKSGLKICEAQYKRCTMIVSNHPIYTKYIKHEKNGLIAKDSRDFTKLIKRLVNNPNMVVDLQNQLREDVKDIFDLTLITQKRVEFYKKLLRQKGLIS